MELADTEHAVPRRASRGGVGQTGAFGAELVVNKVLKPGICLTNNFYHFKMEIGMEIIIFQQLSEISFYSADVSECFI